MRRNQYRIGGFTLIELAIVLAIISLLAPTSFRLYHELVVKGPGRVTEGAALMRDTRILFKYMERDLAQGDQIIQSFGKIKSSATVLIFAGQPLRQQSKSSVSLPRIVSGQSRQIIIYYLNKKREVLREVYNGTIAKGPSVSTFEIVPAVVKQKTYYITVNSQTKDALLGRVGVSKFEAIPALPDASALVKVSLKLRPYTEGLNENTDIYRIFNMI